jgi:hypothetical protein
MFSKSIFVLKCVGNASHWQHRLAATTFAGCWLFSPNLTPAFAQSTNPAIPTPLTNNVLSGRGSMDRDLVYYYRFTAKPGKITITLDLDADAQKGNNVTAAVSLQAQDSSESQSISGAALPGDSSRTVKQLELSAKTPVLLTLKLNKGSTAGYSYRVKIDGD